MCVGGWKVKVCVGGWKVKVCVRLKGEGITLLTLVDIATLGL